jgi:hypothetical protein
MIPVLMLSWNMLWELLGVRMVCPPSIYPLLALSFCPPKTPSFDCTQCPMPLVIKEDFLGRSAVGHSATLRCGRQTLLHVSPPLPLWNTPHSFYRAPLTPLNKRPLSFQSALSRPSSSLTPSDRSRPHRMRRSNSILRPTPSLRIRLYTPRFTPHAILGSLNSIPTYFARGE